MASGPNSPRELLPATVVNGLAGLLAVLVIGAFAYLYGNAIWLTWADASKAGPFLAGSPGYSYTATALAGLVGAIVAAAFNERLPDDPRLVRSARFMAATQGGPLATPSAAAPRAALDALGDLAVPDRRFGWQSIVASIYAIIYFIIGIAAIVTWAAVAGAPDLIKNLSLIALGLFLAIVRSFFRVQ